jgi:short chain dehydrogenase
MTEVLDGRVAIVTGGGHGIGRAYCEGLAHNGAAVVVAAIDGDAAERTASEPRSGGVRALEVQTDVAKEASTLAMAQRALDAFGRIDVLVNNAAVFATMPISRVPLNASRLVRRHVREARADSGGRCRQMDCRSGGERPCVRWWLPTCQHLQAEAAESHSQSRWVHATPAPATVWAACASERNCWAAG